MGDGRFSALQLEYSTCCNMAYICKHCYGATGVINKSEVLRDEVFACILQEARYIARSITITGGEPACFPHAVMRIERESGLPITIMTNGLEFIEGAHPISVLFSLDATDVRMVKNTQLIMQNVLRYGCNVSCNTVLSADLDLFAYYELLKEMHKKLVQRGNQFQEWKLGFIIDKGKAILHRNISPSFDVIFPRLQKFLIQYFRERPFPLAVRGFLYTRFLDDDDADSIRNYVINPHRNPCLDCFGRGEILTVNTSGNVQLCTTCREVSVPIRTNLFDAVFELLSLRELALYTYQDWCECSDCRYKNICGCGCPSLAETYGNTWTGKDVFQCRIMQYWEEYIIPILPQKIKEAYQYALRKR